MAKSPDAQVRLEPTVIGTEVLGEGEFQTGGVVTLAAGHWLHDTYTSFLAPLLPALSDKFLLTKTKAGLLSVFMQSPSVLQPVIGQLADRFSLRYLVILAPGVTATMLSLLGVAPAYAILPFLLIVAGLSSASLHSIGPVMAGRLSGKQLGRGMSFWMVGGEMGRTIGPLILVTAIGWVTLEGLAWLMIGGWTASLLLYLRLKDIPGRPPQVEELPWKKALGEMRTLMLPLSGVMLTRVLLNASLTTYLPTFMRDQGSDLVLAGASLTVLEAAGVVGALLGGSVSDRLGRKSVLLFSSLATPLLTFAFLRADGAFRFGILVPLGFVYLAASPVLMAMPQEQYPDNRALANGLYMAVSFVIYALGVVVLGLLADTFGIRQAFTIGATASLLGVPLITRLPLKR